jgi:hypothetical protein
MKDTMSDYEPTPLEREEAEYHWALSDLACFVGKYGYQRVLQDLLDYVYLKEARPGD